MNAKVPADARPRLGRLFRFQWEPAQKAYVLLYPEGMVKLNLSAGEILQRCDGKRSVAEMVANLEQSFATTGLRGDIEAFLAMAEEKGWVNWNGGVESAS